jgi:hypothetical protein
MWFWGHFEVRLAILEFYPTIGLQVAGHITDRWKITAPGRSSLWDWEDESSTNSNFIKGKMIEPKDQG